MKKTLLCFLALLLLLSGCVNREAAPEETTHPEDLFFTDPAPTPYAEEAADE